MTQDAAQVVLDRMETADVAHRYATAVDSRDWPLLRTVFADRMTADFRSFGAREVYRGSGDGWVEAVRQTVEGMDATQHMMSNHVHRFEGTAHCTLTSYMRAEHFLRNDRGGDRYTIGGLYVWELARAPEGWKVEAYSLKVAWARGNRHLLAMARRAVQGG